eukprot:9218332-Alexandrium_andersonii.AAC.1
MVGDGALEIMVPRCTSSAPRCALLFSDCSFQGGVAVALVVRRLTDSSVGIPEVSSESSSNAT